MGFGIKTLWQGRAYWAFSTSTDQGSVVSFSDACNTLRMGGKVIQQTSSTTWLMHLNDAAHYTVSKCGADNILIQLRLAPTTGPQSGSGRPCTTSLQSGTRYFCPVAGDGQLVTGNSTEPAAISQLLFGRHAAIAVGLSQIPSQPQAVAVSVFITNQDAPMMQVDDSKFFVLDGQDQQLRHVSLEGVKYSVQSWLAQNLRAANYPPPTPPPPEHRYVITGTQNGNYTFTAMGNMGTISGSSSSTYSVQEQTDTLNQTGYMLGYTLGLAIRRFADRKHNNKVLQQAQQTVSQIDGLYFHSESPIIPGETRKGAVIYLTGSTRPAEGPFKVVLFLTDPASGKQEPVKFEFQ
ncbi:MAG: hypothetical protein ABSG41_29805 [Bryobacteraceae bacterium]